MKRLSPLLFRIATVAFLCLSFQVADPMVVRAAYSNNLVCDTYTASPQVTIHCSVDVVRPSGNTQATHMQLAVYSDGPIAITAYQTNNSIPYCQIDQQDHHLACWNYNPNDPPPAQYKDMPYDTPMRIYFNVIFSSCGSGDLNTWVANIYGQDSAKVYTPTMQTPAGCGTPPPPPPPPACTSNAQCGTDGFTGGSFCQSNGVYQNYKTYTCNNPGTSSASCSNSTTARLQQTCPSGNSQSCSNGSCTAISSATSPITCYSNSQCGSDGFSGSQFCQNGNVSRNYFTYTCQNPGTTDSKCVNSSSTQVQTICAGNQSCSNGGCVASTQSDQNTSGTVTCYSNANCGASGFIGNNFCQANSVYRNSINYTCQNPGTANSRCINSTSPQLQQNCGANQACYGGSCLALTQYNDIISTNQSNTSNTNGSSNNSTGGSNGGNSSPEENHTIGTFFSWLYSYIAGWSWCWLLFWLLLLIIIIAIIVHLFRKREIHVIREENIQPPKNTNNS